MAWYGEAFRNKVVARLLPPERANVSAVAKKFLHLTCGAPPSRVQWTPARGSLAPP